ncbi:Ketosteroid isomerase homolog [hydrothermal vent metagenome]|uniref:Ketosteroid isomerase homolog n=1 Tax=hydrothermal vent metagenome TaxID=652676 RepID=A0A3B1D2Q0_9ZZZZ
MNINDVINHYEKSLNASDTGSILKLYGEDPIFMPQHAPAQVGRDQVRAAYEHVFDSIKLNIKFTVYEVEEFGNLAYVRTSSEGTTTIRANDEIVNEGNNELFVFRKENGDWKIHRYIFSTSNPR